MSALLDRLAGEKLKQDAETLRAEGWKWIVVAPSFPAGHDYRLRRLAGEPIPPTAEEETANEAIAAEREALEREHGDADEIPDDVSRRIDVLDETIANFEDRPRRYDAAEVARAGVFVTIDHDGRLLIKRGYVHAEDEAPTPTATARRRWGRGGAVSASPEWRGSAGPTRRDHDRRGDGSRPETQATMTFCVLCPIASSRS